MINWKSVRRMPVQRAFYPNVTENSSAKKACPLKIEADALRRLESRIRPTTSNPYPPILSAKGHPHAIQDTRRHRPPRLDTLFRHHDLPRRSRHIQGHRHR